MTALPNAAALHTLRLCDTSESLVASVVSFVREGLANGGIVLAVMRPEHSSLVVDGLRRYGEDVEAHLAAERLIPLNAESILPQLILNGRINRSLFETVVGDLVRSLVSRGPSLRIYGEMVDILVERRAIDDAFELEVLWNLLGTATPFHLFCGYRSAHLSHRGAERALRRICACHDVADAAPGDALAQWLMAEAQGSSGPDTSGLVH